MCVFVGGLPQYASIEVEVKAAMENLTSDLSICQVAKTSNECFILTVN